LLLSDELQLIVVVSARRNRASVNDCEWPRKSFKLSWILLIPVVYKYWFYSLAHTYLLTCLLVRVYQRTNKRF